MTPIRYWPQKSQPIQAAPPAGPWLRFWTPTLSLLLLLILELVSWAFPLISWAHPCSSINPLMLSVTGVCFSCLHLRTPTQLILCWLTWIIMLPPAGLIASCLYLGQDHALLGAETVLFFGVTLYVSLKPPITERLVSSDAGSAVGWWAPAVSPFSCQPHQQTVPCPRPHPHIGFLGTICNSLFDN